jgi:hypothetical protein
VSTTATPTVSASRDRPRTRWLADGVIAGFVAVGASTAVLVLAFTLAAGFGSPTGDVVHEWSWELTHNNVVSFSQAAPAIALAIHVIAGLIWAIIYAGLVEYRLPSSWPSWERGVAWGVLVWILSWLVFLPLVGAGVAGASLGAGPLPIIGNLILHLVYGFVLGQLYDPTAGRPAVAADTVYDEPLESYAVAQSEVSSAAGIVVGAVVGAIVGVGMAVVLPPTLPAIDFSGWELALAVGGLLAGGAVGGVVGSFAGLPHEAPSTDSDGLGPDPFEHVVLPFLIPPFLAIVIAAAIILLGTTLLRVAPYEIALPFGISITAPVLVALFGIVIVAIVAIWLNSRPQSDQVVSSPRDSVSHGSH